MLHLLPDDLDMSQYMFPRTLIIHELLHALGIQGHADSIEFPDSIMGTSGDFFPNPGFTIHRIDREVLQVMYMSKRTDKYNLEFCILPDQLPATSELRPP